MAPQLRQDAAYAGTDERAETGTMRCCDCVSFDFLSKAPQETRN